MLKVKTSGSGRSENSTIIKTNIKPDILKTLIQGLPERYNTFKIDYASGSSFYISDIIDEVYSDTLNKIVEDILLGSLEVSIFQSVVLHIERRAGLLLRVDICPFALSALEPLITTESIQQDPDLFGYQVDHTLNGILLSRKLGDRNLTLIPGRLAEDFKTFLTKLIFIEEEGELER